MYQYPTGLVMKLSIYFGEGKTKCIILSRNKILLELNIKIE